MCVFAFVFFFFFGSKFLLVLLLIDQTELCVDFDIIFLGFAFCSIDKRRRKHWIDFFSFFSIEGFLVLFFFFVV